MMQSFRDNLKGTVAMFLVVLVSIPFIFFGVDSLFTGDAKSGQAASINGDVVSEDQVRRAIGMQRDQLSQRFGDQLPADFLSDERLRGPAVDGLVSRQLRIQGATEGRMTISDKALDALIVGAPAFQVDGKFDPQRFTYMVQSMGYTASGYREMIRQEIISQQYMSSVALGGFVTEQQLAQHVRLSDQTRDFYYVTLPLAPVMAATEIDSAAIDAYYQANQTQYQIPEMVSVKAIELNVADIAAGVEVSDEQVAAQYEENMKSYETAPVRHAAHILVEVEDDTQAQAKLAEIEQALAGGQDFAEVASSFSDDLGTREAGGDLGFTSGDTFPEEFETALAALEVGAVSAPVKTDAGWHVIKLVAIENAELPSLEEEMPTIRMALADSMAQQLFVEKLELLKEEAFKQDDIELVAQTLGVNTVSVPAFSRAGGNGLAADSKVVSAAFSDEVLVDGRISPVLELSETSVAVVRLAEHMPAKVKPLAEVADLIETQLKEEKAQATLSAQGETLLASLATGADVESVAKAAGYDWQVSTGVKRADSRYDRAMLQQVFDMNQSADDEPAYSQVYSQTGDLVLLKLVKVEDGQLENLSAEQRTALAQRLSYDTANAEVLAYEAVLKEAADIKIF
ncbi:SurA N-terminal domain-containing protein [Simiduia curdlanivorans]|uniref:Periplasmic chaperone PpiD n=1 Tax=Simiduia curdlanivorans TaxID=1492769 RepID=A0ABV8V1Q6_9GAMM|nr:SurA N-terminal domain-containing protein [Simiduia curdlanivorans]MDN3640020.1 SurA N-terminal domain-containing protein [Simiduia curdlanivorans]